MTIKTALAGSALLAEPDRLHVAAGDAHRASGTVVCDTSLSMSTLCSRFATLASPISRLRNAPADPHVAPRRFHSIVLQWLIRMLRPELRSEGDTFCTRSLAGKFRRYRITTLIRIDRP